jgi:predicted DNA-binding transcriptional regulator YafY
LKYSKKWKKMGQLERITWINRMLEAGEPLSSRIAAKRFEVAEKTAKRDIEYLRDRCNAPVSWNASRHSYEYTSHWQGFAFLDEHSLLAAAFLKAILGQFDYVPVIADSLREEFVEQLPADYRAIVDSIEYSLPQIERIPDALVYELCNAVRTRRLIHVAYTNSCGESTERNIEPRKLVNYAGKWYTIAYDHRRTALRTFALNRVTSFSATEERFLDERASGATKENVDAFISSTYGIYKGDIIGTAVLRFYGRAAANIKNTVWHPDQTITEIHDGVHGFTLELSLPVHDYPELLGRALRCGASCEVVAPSDFREMWHGEIRKMSRLADNKSEI